VGASTDSNSEAPLRFGAVEEHADSMSIAPMKRIVHMLLGFMTHPVMMIFRVTQVPED